MDKIIKICIFDKNAKKSDVIETNGDCILDEVCTSCETSENIDGIYELDATFIIDGDKSNYINEESILKVKMDYGDEIFRITKVLKNTHDIDVYARQITVSECLDLWLDDVRPRNLSGQGALTYMLEKAEGNKEIELYSNITSVSTAYHVRKSLYDALHDSENSFQNRWGGEILRRGYKLSINNSIGQDRGVDIRSRKNLTGFEADIDIDTVCTRIKPMGFDGITIDGYVDSPLINNYARIKTRKIKYEDVKVKDSEQQIEGEEPTPTEDQEGFDTLEEAQAELIRLAKLEFEENKIDELRATYNINFVDLSQTEEYKDYIQAERVYLGDTVHVYEEKNNISIDVKVTKRKYDVLAQRVKEIELSNNTSNSKITISDVLVEIGKITNEDKSLTDHIHSLISSGIKDSHVIVRENEIIIGDTKDINTMTNVWRWNKNGLAFSNQGYYGNFNVAITADGKIIGDFIYGLHVKGEQIDARNLNVNNNNGEKTLEVTAGGEVNINANSFNVKGQSVTTKSELSVVKDEISLSVQETEKNLKSELSVVSGQISSKVSSGEVYSIIEQSPNAVKYAFNGISSYVNIDRYGLEVDSGRIKTDALIPGADSRIVLEPGYYWGNGQDRNDIRSIDANFGDIRLKYNDTNYMSVTRKGIDFYVNNGDLPAVLIDSDGIIGYAKYTHEFGNYYRIGDYKNGSSLVCQYPGTGIRIKSDAYESYASLGLNSSQAWLNQGSDIRLKENVHYLKEENLETENKMSTLSLTNDYAKSILYPMDNNKDDNILLYNEETYNNKNISRKDLYDFVKNDLKLCEYNYINNEDINLNFIAQDIANTKIGSLFVTRDESGYLGFKLNHNYINIAFGALQHEISQREKLEKELKFKVNELESKVNKMETELNLIKESLSNQ